MVCLYGVVYLVVRSLRPRLLTTPAPKSICTSLLKRKSGDRRKGSVGHWKMHPLLIRLLQHRQLNSAGQLFTISHYEVITDLHSTFSRIKEMFNDDDYVNSRVDQSVVEIVIARITAAIRETGCIETYAAELVDLLDESLKHGMISLDVDGEQIDSPHCKIASDLLSSLFLHYGRKSVMTLALPVAIKALASSNPELVRNTTSYISLAAIHNGKALSHYALQIISHITNGNYSLLRVLPQIYADNREPFHAHISQLLDMLHMDEVDCSEKLSVMQLTSMVANTKADVLTPFLAQIDEHLLSQSMCTAVLNIYMTFVSKNRAHFLSSFLPTLKAAAKSPSFVSNRPTICKIIGNIGRVSPSLASEAVEELVRLTSTNTDSHLLPSILIEIEGVGAAYPSALRPHIDSFPADITDHSINNSRIVDRILALASSRIPSPSCETTVIAVDGKQGNKENSMDSLLSKNSRFERNIITSGPRTVFAVCDSPADTSALELDRNTHSLAMQYQNRSSGSLSRHSRSHASVAHSLHGQRSTSEMCESREMSLLSVPGCSSSRQNEIEDVTTSKSSKTQTLPAGFAPVTNIQMSKDGRVRPVGGGRRPVQWPAGSTETTFPAHPGPVTTTKMHPLSEEDESKWNNSADRSDLVQQFVEHRKNKIRRYIADLSARFPVPVQCTVEGSKNSKHRMVVHFSCQSRTSSYCVFTNDYLFAFKTKNAASWLHLMFLQMECSALAQNGEVAGKNSSQYQTLAHCWQCLPHFITKSVPFDTLVTSAFPNVKDQEKMNKELDEAGFFGCFSLEGSSKWTCISCAHPDKVRSFVNEGACEKVLEGQLKEKKGRWRFLRRWHTKYFTLSSAALNYSSQEVTTESRSLLPAIDLRTVRSVRSLSRGKKSRKSLRRAFEIFTSDNTSVVLKATDEKKAEEWLQCLQIAVAHARRENS
ncbi:unnamed protein product [Caenorhabditis auriculariae]|uniref:PH domain-containing protein n=1 Tax=Caenorhabditis auriculariae TaxID=2777116 RepID=A0A8S1HDU3_9PELO|nr:unnamed protein product [Caenorhabditis auriculariae]